jgi:penicillin-binding protein 1B
MLKRLFYVLVSLCLTGLILGGAAVTAGWYWLDAEVARLTDELRPRVAAVRDFTETRGGWAFPSTVWSDWFELAEGKGFGVERVAREAKARGYRKVEDDSALEPGAYRLDGKGGLTIRLRGFDFPEGRVGPVTLSLTADKARLTRLEVVDGPPWPVPYRLEPLYLDTWIPESNEIRIYTPLAEIPPVVQQAILASEDARFREHKGVDHIGILRAIRRNVQGTGPMEGASTITQQVVRTFFLSRERSFRRKVNEALRALALERVVDKDAILELYLNSVYLGQVNGRSVGGVAAGARQFFDKSLAELSLDEAATLAAIIPAPVRFSPVKNPEVTRQRRERVLDRMADLGHVARADADAAKPRPVVLRTPAPLAARWPLWSQWARKSLTEAFCKPVAADATASAADPGALAPAQFGGGGAGRPAGAAACPLGDPAARGLRIFTSLDVALQSEAEVAVARSVGELEAEFGVWRRDPLQGAAFGLDPQTGLALFAVAGRGVPGDQFNRAVQARRSPGSAIKPVAYAAVLSEKDESGQYRFTPAHTVSDERTAFDTPEGKWSPRNSDGLYHPWVTIAKGFAKSMNVATTNLVVAVGPQKVADLARRLGMRGDIRVVPSIGLGSSEVTAAELVGALSTVAVGGKRVDVSAVRVAVDRTGRPVWSAPPPTVQVLDPVVAGEMYGLMKNSYERGTGFEARIMLGSSREVVGKTGTSQAGRDLWFVGVAMNMAIGYWVGHDLGHPIWAIAGETIAPAWGRMVRPLFADLERVPFPLPEGVQVVNVDPYSGCKGGGFPVVVPVGQPLPKCRPIDWEIPKRSAEALAEAAEKRKKRLERR